MTNAETWLSERIDGAPAVLRTRAEEAVRQVDSDSGILAERLRNNFV